MIDQFSIILTFIVVIINSLIFGYVASNSKKNKTNQAYLIFLFFIISYTIFDCVIIQLFDSNYEKDIIVKIQALFWMPLSAIYLNFIYIFLRKKKDQVFYVLITIVIVSVFFTIITDNVILRYKDFNLGTMAYTGPWFLPITFFGILPAAIYSIYLIGKESGLFKKKNSTIIGAETLLASQLKFLFIGSIGCIAVAVTTNIFFDEILGYSGELHLASLSLSLHIFFLLPALIKYNFLNRPIEQLGDELYAHSKDAVFIINQHGIILNLNKSARKMFKLSGRILNKQVQSLFSSDFYLSEKNENYITSTKENKHVTISQTNITQGNLYVGKILVIRDITSKILIEKKLLKSEESYKNLIKKSGDLIYNIDLNGNFTFVNPIVEKVSGYTRKELLGKNSNFLVREENKKNIIKIFSQMITKKNKKLERSLKTEIPIITKQGKELWMELGVTTIVKNNKIIGFSVISRDITARKNAEKKLRQTTNELTAAQDVANLGSFIFDIKKNKVTWSSKLYELYGLNKKTFFPTKNNFFDKVVHPESRKYAKKTVEDALKNNKKELEYEHKTLTPQGKEKWMQAKIKIEYNKKNEPIIMNGTSQDITELYTTRNHLEKSELRLKKAQEIANLGTWEENHQTGTIFWSSILKNMFGVSKNKEITSNLFWEMVHPEDLVWMKKEWENARFNKKPYSGTFKILLNNGQIKHLNEHAEFITDQKGNLIKTIGTVIDITEIHNYQNKLKELSYHIQQVQEKERGYIAREVHDELGQRLTSMNMEIALLKNKIDNNNIRETSKRLKILRSLVEETISMTRKISQELRPTILDDLGLIDALGWLKEQYNQRTDIKFKLNAPTTDIQINNEYSTAVFRIAQEALTNIIKHSNAKNVNINIDFKNSLIKLLVKDDGIGITEKKKKEKGKTYGVFGMQERASSLGGQLLINKNTTKGTSVSLILPYKPE